MEPLESSGSATELEQTHTHTHTVSFTISLVQLHTHTHTHTQSALPYPSYGSPRGIKTNAYLLTHYGANEFAANPPP